MVMPKRRYHCRNTKAVISLSVCEKRIDIRRFLGYVCHIAKVRVRMSFRWVSLFAQKFVFFDFFVRMRIDIKNDYKIYVYLFYVYAH